jgi:hypothetical protein
MDIQSKEIKGLCVANGTLKEQLSNQLKDRDLQMKEVKKVVRDENLDRTPRVRPRRTGGCICE